LYGKRGYGKIASRWCGLDTKRKEQRTKESALDKIEGLLGWLAKIQLLMARR
jgi:hypothetical protein